MVFVDDSKASLTEKYLHGKGKIDEKEKKYRNLSVSRSGFRSHSQFFCYFCVSIAHQFA